MRPVTVARLTKQNAAVTAEIRKYLYRVIVPISPAGVRTTVLGMAEVQRDVEARARKKVTDSGYAITETTSVIVVPTKRVRTTVIKVKHFER